MVLYPLPRGSHGGGQPLRAARAYEVFLRKLHHKQAHRVVRHVLRVQALLKRKVHKLVEQLRRPPVVGQARGFGQKIGEARVIRVRARSIRNARSVRGARALAEFSAKMRPEIRQPPLRGRSAVVLLPRRQQDILPRRNDARRAVRRDEKRALRHHYKHVFFKAAAVVQKARGAYQLSARGRAQRFFPTAHKAG